MTQGVCGYTFTLVRRLFGLEEAKAKADLISKQSQAQFIENLGKLEKLPPLARDLGYAKMLLDDPALLETLKQVDNLKRMQIELAKQMDPAALEKARHQNALIHTKLAYGAPLMPKDDNSSNIPLPPAERPRTEE